jgi:hypothetical protein
MDDTSEDDEDEEATAGPAKVWSDYYAKTLPLWMINVDTDGCTCKDEENDEGGKGRSRCSDYRAKLSLNGWSMSSRMIFLKAKKMKKSDAGGVLFRSRESYRPPDFRCSRPPDGPTTDSVPRTARNRIFPRDQVLVFFLILFFCFFWWIIYLFICLFLVKFLSFQCETHFHHKKKKKKKKKKEKKGLINWALK